MISSQPCRSGTQAPERSDLFLSELQAFLAIPRMLAGMQAEVLDQRNRQVMANEQIRELNRSVQVIADNLTVTQRTLGSLAGNLSPIRESIRHIASANEQLGEQYFRRHIAAPLGSKVLDLMGLIEQMDLEPTDSEILCTALTDLLTIFFMELYEPESGDHFDSKTMTATGPLVGTSVDSGSATPVVGELVRPGILFQADGDETMVLRHATVSLAEEELFENHEPDFVLAEEDGPQSSVEAMEQMASGDLDDDLFISQTGGVR